MIQENNPKKFGYYFKLNVFEKRIYNQSDSIKKLDLPLKQKFFPLISKLKIALNKEDKTELEKTIKKIIYGFSIVFRVPQVHLKLLDARPHNQFSELHGLYERTQTQATITLWMRTARQTRIVSFKTFLRTLIHEILHHLDYTYYRLQESFHTHGFYARESHLMRQLLLFEQN